MLKPTRSSAFQRDVKRLKKRRKNLDKLQDLLTLLIEGQKLPEHYKDHALQGDWRGFRDAHIEPDWLLLYRVIDEELQLARTGSHADLFKE